MNKNEIIRKSPIDFLYIFVTSDYLSAIASAFSQSHAANIKSKYVNAKRYVSGWAKEQGTTFDKAKEQVRELINQQFGKSPEKILVAMAKGEMIPGVDFSAGVYGVGDLTQLTFNQNPGASVDPTSGKITFDTGTPEDWWQTIDQNNKTVGFTYTLGGKTYNSRYNPATGQYFADTCGSADAMQFANGTTYDASKASSVWQNLNTALPIVENFMEWLASFVPDVVGKFTPITTNNTVPRQSDYYTSTSPKPGTTIAGFGIVGALLIGGLLLGRKRKN